jgi:catechol 2,3-dioxygenase-like lactoylglutathione lyase family enzyme
MLPAMNTLRIDHVNVRTTQLDEMIRWYTDVLGLQSGPRPNFSFPGAWMYAGDFPVVHLVGVDGEPGKGAESKLKLEHFAFRSTGCAAFEARLTERGETFKRRDLTDFKLAQVNVWDPDGNHIHIDFPLDESND